MTRYVDVTHAEWIAAPVETVRAQFADLDHHIQRNVHPKLRFEVLERRPDREASAAPRYERFDSEGRAHGARFVQEVRLLGIRQRDVFERTIEPDGTIEDVSVEGFNRGGSLRFAFEPERREGRAGTLARISIRLPLPPLVGRLLRPLLEAQVRKELRAAALEDKADIEGRGYPAAPGDSVRPAAADA